eukprot:g4008.t1
MYEDGRTSLKKHIVGNDPAGEIASNVTAETSPLMAIIAGAIVLVGGFSAYFMMKSPDVQISKEHRSSHMPTEGQVAAAEKWSTHKDGFARASGVGVTISDEKRAGKA